MAKIGKDIHMSAIMSRNDAPGHLSNIRELDFSGDLFSERLDGPWFRLGAQTRKDRPDERGVENGLLRQSVLLAPEGFAAVFDKLNTAT